MVEQDNGGCPAGLQGEIAALRRELNEKHQQNRVDIHQIKNDQQKAALEFTELEGRLKPLIGNGQPGLIAQMSKKLDEVIEQLTEVRIDQGSDKGRIKEWDWVRGVAATFIVGLLLILAQHFWK
jgi:hypothetical protein